ncbi:MAG: hypothetical protein IPM56_08945 [Ignavibacteriales bacterium]|nr:MAG: hypothetical protein IPM56_08945 [Ignavibacteriales bacterium]
MIKHLLTVLLCSSFLLYAQTSGGNENKIFKTLDDDNSKFTNIGNLGLTLTNFGMYGHGFSLWPDQPNCEYPLGSGIEHIFDGGLWIGGVKNSIQFVTTASVDASSVSARGGGFEYTNEDGSMIQERSSLFESSFYSPLAISHQDFVMDFTDSNRTLANGEIIEGHEPLGVVVHQEVYNWNFPFSDFFVIMNYTIKNASNSPIDSVYVGLWTDAVVRNTRVTGRPSGSAFFNKGGNGYNDSIKIAYEFDATGDPGFTDSYVGVQSLGSDPVLPAKVILGQDTASTVNFVSWQFRNTDDPNFFAPQDDLGRYRKLSGYFGGQNRWKKGIDPNTLKVPSNRSMLISNGPFTTLAPGDSINVVFAIVCAKKFGDDPAALDTEEQKINLYSNADWALRAYFGEDRNRNGILDSGEDLDGNGKITRYILPSPPTPPIVKVVPENQKAIIYWDDRAENSVDPISGLRDFEGYKIYRTQAGFDLTETQDIRGAMVLQAQFDSTDNDVGYNTGFSYVRLEQPVTFPNDPVEYRYRYEVPNLLNGWQYIFSVAAFDEGDPANELDVLESSPLANFERILPGTPSSEDANLEVGVYPNPYYANAIWDGSSERLRKIYFFNLPAECEITIYTLAGDVIKRIQHNKESNGSDLSWFENYANDGKQKFAGGEHAWDLLTDNDQAIATGLYLFTVKNNSNGEIKKGKFLIIK